MSCLHLERSYSLSLSLFLSTRYNNHHVTMVLCILVHEPELGNPPAEETDTMISTFIATANVWTPPEPQPLCRIMQKSSTPPSWLSNPLEKSRHLATLVNGSHASMNWNLAEHYTHKTTCCHDEYFHDNNKCLSTGWASKRTSWTPS